MASDDDLHLRPVLRRAWEQPFTARSRFCRDEPHVLEAVMRCVELGLLTLRRGAGAWTNVLHITPAGLSYLDPLNYAPTPADDMTEEE